MVAGPSDHTKLLDRCALHYVRKVYKNHTVRLHGRVIDIPKRPDAKCATYAGKEVVSNYFLDEFSASRALIVLGLLILGVCLRAASR